VNTAKALERFIFFRGAFGVQVTRVQITFFNDFL
jgi:hypothetical protein